MNAAVTRNRELISRSGRTYPPRRTPPTVAPPLPTALPSTKLWPRGPWLTTGHGPTPGTQRKLLTNERTYTPPIPRRRTSAAGQQAQAPPPPTQDHQPMTNPNITPTGTLQHKVAVATTPAAPKTDHRHITHTRNSTRRRFRPRMSTRIAWRYAQARPSRPHHQQSPNHQPQLSTQPHRPSPQSTT